MLLGKNVDVVFVQKLDSLFFFLEATNVFSGKKIFFFVLKKHVFNNNNN